MKRRKTLVLKRAYFPTGVNLDLETILGQLSAKFARPEDRVTPVDLFRQQALAHVEKNPKGAGVFARFFEFEEGATGLVDLASKDMSAEIEELLPPQNRQFLVDEIVLLVTENNVIACGLGNKQGTFASLVHALAEKLKILDRSAQFRISDVPNRKTLEQIRVTGVKTIDLSIESYLASLERIEPGTIGSRVWKALFLSPDGKENLRKRAAMGAKLSITRGRFKKEEVKKDDWMTFVGSEIIDSGFSDDYKLILEDDSVVSNQNLRVSKQVDIVRHANSVSYSQTKLELAQYLIELNADGSLRW